MTTTILPGFPDATTTGVPAGVVLTPQGDLVVNTAGAVISGLDIKGTVYVNAPNVTIENCRIDANGGYFCIDAGASNGATGLTVKNCTLLNSVPGKVDGQNILCTGATIENCDISGMTHCISSDGGNLIQNNYMHDLNGTTNGHYECIYVGGGAAGDTIQHNTMISFDTAVVFMKTDYGPVNNMVIDNNLMLQQNPLPVAGLHTTSYDIYLDNTGAGMSGNVVTNNIMQKGYYGFTSVTNPGSVTWQGNTDLGSGQTISMDGTLSGAPTTSTAPASPTIASFSTDSGVSGDGITSDNTLDLKGTAAAGSTVKIFDGTTQLGSTTATSTGTWDYITQVLTDAKHTLTATATNSSGQVSAASAALPVTVDTKAPAAPTVTSDTVNSGNQVVAAGTAEASSTIKVYDGTTQVGTATTNASGAWMVTTTALAAGTHALTAKATDAAGNVSAASQPFDPVVGSGSTPPPTTGGGSTGSGSTGSGSTGSGSTGSGLTGLVTVGDNYFLGSTGPELKYQGAPVTAGQFQDWVPISSVQVAGGGYDVAWKNSSGQFTFWATDTQGNFQSYPTNGVPLAANGATVEKYETIFNQDLNGDHTIGIPGATSGSGTSSGTGTSGTGTSGTVDTTAPDAPVLLSDATYHHRATVTGTAEVGSTVNLYEGTTLLGTATTGADGHFSVTTSSLKNGSHTFVATATDAAGNTSAVSQPIDPPIGSHSATGTSTTGTSTTGTSTVDVTNVRQHWDHTATIKGIADPNSQIKLNDGTTSAGSVTAGDNGKWSFQTSDLSGKAHAFTAEQVDTTGHVVGTSSGEAIIGSRQGETLTGTTGNDVMVGKGGADTFVFASNFGHDVIKDLATGGPAHDAIQFSKSVFDSFASVLSHAAQSGHDVVIATGSDTLTLKNTKLDALNSHDFHFA